MDTPALPRHRKPGSRGLVTASLLIALGVGFLAGMGTNWFLLDGANDESSASAPAPSSASAPASGATPNPAASQDQTPQATGEPAPADPAPPGPQGDRAYLATLEDAGLPVKQHREAILVLGRIACEAPPSERGNSEAAADRVVVLADDLLSRPQALQLVQVAAQELCGS